MKRGMVVFFIMVILLPLSYSLSVKELISKYSFSTSTSEMNITGFVDYMTDKDGNGINETLVFELNTSNIKGIYIFVVSIFDKNGILTNETNASLNSGANKINITFGSTLLSQSQFNYSIKIYNSTYSLKYRKDGVSTNSYFGYESGFKLLDIKDFKSGKSLMLNATINSTVAGNFRARAFLGYNNSTIYSADNKTITNSVQDLIFNFDNETIKKTHYSGSFRVSSLSIGYKKFAADFPTKSYDFRDFAESSYLSGFSDAGLDTEGSGKNDILRITAESKILKDGNYKISLSLYDIFGNLVESKNSSAFLNSGSRAINFDFNGSRIFDKKLNGPFVVKNAELFENGALTDRLAGAYTTKNYNFNDFENKNLPDLMLNISVSGGYHFGINNITLNVTIKNIGSRHAFGIFTEIFDNNTFSKSNITNFLRTGSLATYQIEFRNISDFEISAITDFNDFIEEINENNNAKKVLIKLNKNPNLTAVKNITVNETDKAAINLSAYDANDDNISYSINYSKFSSSSNIFEWATSTMDSGDYTLAATVSDGYMNDSAIFEIHVLDVPEIDSDNDGINDTLDNFIGSEKSINTSTINATLSIDDSGNISKIFNETRKVSILDNNLAIAEFDFNFSKFKLNFSNLTINKQSSNSTGALVFRGLSLPDGLKKTLYVDRLNSGINGLCIKDREISSIAEISADCNLDGEYGIECDGTLQNDYKCTYNFTLNKYKVEGLKHSGIMQFDYTKPASGSGTSPASSGGGTGSSGGGNIICISKWQCGDWSECIDGISARKCNDSNKCYSPTNEPDDKKECGINNKNLNYFNKNEDYNIRNDLQRLNRSGNIFMATGAVIKNVALDSYFGVYAVLIIVLFIGGFYFNKKYRYISRIFK